MWSPANIDSNPSFSAVDANLRIAFASGNLGMLIPILIPATSRFRLSPNVIGFGSIA